MAEMEECGIFLLPQLPLNNRGLSSPCDAVGEAIEIASEGRKRESFNLALF